MRFIKQIPTWWLLIIGIVIATGAVWQATRLTYQVELESMIETGGERLTLYTGTLRGALSRYAYLPYVLASSESVKEMLASGRTAPEVNSYLEELNRKAGSATLYVMDASGQTLATSNWREPLSYLGRNYAFRPYFTAAREGRQGRFFAIGVTTGEPGFFMSHPILREGHFIGVAVVKVNLDPLQTDWRQGGETVLVSDANGVLFLSSREDWKYRTLAPLTTGQRKTIRAGRQYGDQPLNLVPLRRGKILSENLQIVRADNLSYLMLSRALPGLDWKLLHLASLAPVRERTQAVAVTGTALSLLILALGMYLRERRQKQLSRRQAQEAEAFQQVNLRLQAEIDEHRRTEQALRDAQAELVQSSKLAALGQMAAGIVHELNQPISAMRTYAASGRLLLERQETAQAREIFASVNRITEHMASVTAQLKIFAHKAPAQSGRVVIQDCIASALSMTAALFREFNVVLQQELPQQPVVLCGDSSRIEQVLVNLIHNGIDAMTDSPHREMRIQVKVKNQKIKIIIADSGSGIAKKNLDELFNPFFTTKEVGKGLGLGLSISYRIVTDLGGTIRAINNPEAGASFIVRLPLWNEKTEGDER